MDRRIQDDGTVVVSGQIVPVGGAQPTTAAVVSYGGSSGLQSTNVEGALDELDAEKAPITHTHDDRYFTEVEVTNLLAGKAAAGHNHDDRYYTEVEVTTLLGGKSDLGHNHDDRYYTEAEVNQRIAEALGSLDSHANPSFDDVVMSTDGPEGDVVPARLYPTGWGNFWASGGSSTRPILSADSSVTRLGPGYSMKVTLPGTDSTQTLTSSVFAVTPGSVISVEAWVCGTGPKALVTLLTNKDVDPDFFVSGTASIDTPTIIPGGVWQRIQTALTVPAEHNKARFMLRGTASSSGASPGTLWWDDTKSKVQVFPPSGVVTGEIKMWPTSTAPEGYLLCNGASFSSTTYPALAALLGDTFGTHSGTTYYLPDFRGRSPLGAGTASPAVPGGTAHTLGQKGGEERHTQTLAELAAHGHDLAVRVYSTGFADWQPAMGNGGGTEGNVAGLVKNAGSSTPFNVLSPFLGINYIIKAN